MKKVQVPGLTGKGGAESWNELKGKPFNSTESVCDFATAPSVSFDALGFTWWKVSDLSLTTEQLLKTNVSVDFGTGAVVRKPTEEEFLFNTEKYSSFQFATNPSVGFFVGYEAGDMTINYGGQNISFTVPEAGTYAGYEMGQTPPSSLIIGLEYVETIDPKFLPEELYTQIDARIDSYINEALGGEY